MSVPIGLLVVDDHPILRQGVMALLENDPGLTVLGEAGNGDEALEMVRRLKPDVVLMDIQMPGLDGIDAITAIRRDYPDMAIVVLTTYPGDAQAIRALKAGAAGYMLKSSLRGELVKVIRHVHAGGRYVAPDVAEAIALDVGNHPVSPREAAVLRLVAEGHSNRQAASRLGVAEETIKAHLKSIFDKLGVSDRTHAVTVAIRRGLIQP